AASDRDVTFVEADHDHYATVAERVRTVLRDHAGEIEVASIDEAYADLSHLDGYGAARDVAETVQREIRGREGLTASVGIGPNKLVAKMASDRDKPGGMTVVEPDEVAAFLGDLPVEDLHGVGPKTAGELAAMDVETVADLRDVPAQRLVREFGEARGMALYTTARGEGSTDLAESEQKQLSRITTLAADTDRMGDLRPVIRDLAGDVMDRVTARNWMYSTVTAICITSDRDTRTRSRSFKTASGDRERFFRTAEDLVATFLDEEDAALRRVGVRAAGFDTGGQQTLGDF
ncbi:MAG: DNA polymerase IV, partial [Candidatus Nanohaloarchaea archaeon]